MTLLKAFGIWLLLVVLAILNGALREKLLVPLFGRQAALPLSGLSLALLIFLVTWLLLPALSPLDTSGYWAIGGLWASLTVLFEFLFGHYAADKSWRELLASYDLRTGNLWPLVLLVTALAPYLAARLHGFL